MTELSPITEELDADRIEALREAAEALERASGLPTERELVVTLVDALPSCVCGKPATWRASGGGHICDVCWGPDPRAHKMRGVAELSYAASLRALLARMATWPAADAVANDGGAG